MADTPEKPEVPEDDDDKTIIHTQPPVPPGQRSQPPAGEVDPTVEDAPIEEAAPPPPPPAPVAEEEDEGLIGAVINNNYKILELINAGGMGEVYRGEQVFTSDPVAIKIVLPALAQDEKVMTLFKREARILSQLADEAIVRYYNFVHDPTLDRFCLIMDFIDGVPLSDQVAQDGPITLDSAQRLMVRLANGLDKAHNREVTHRDLSPDNVMLPLGDVDRAVLIDFGIAKSTEVTEGTLHGQFAGKFKYISPEQLGHVEAVNARREIPDLAGIYPEMQPLIAHMLEPDPALRPARMLDVAAMVVDPSKIPPRYYGGSLAPQGPVDDEATVLGSQPPQMTHPGFTTPPLTQTTGIRTPPGLSPAQPAPVPQAQDLSQSPFGGGTATPFGQTAPPHVTQIPQAAMMPVEDEKGGASAGGRGVLRHVLWHDWRRR